MIGRRPPLAKPKPKKIIKKGRIARRTDSDANAIVKKYIRFTKSIAREMADSMRLTPNLKDELNSVALEALVVSSRRIRITDENELMGYLGKRIRGAIIDFLRKEIITKRGTKRKSYQEIKDPKLGTTKRGTKITKGKCPHCGITVCRMGG